MKVEIKIPAMGESVTKAIISSLLKPTGSTVKRDEEIVEIETDKVNQVLYAPQSGKLTWNVCVNDEVAIGAVIGTIETDVQISSETPKKEEPPKPAKKEELPKISPALPTEGFSARKTVDTFVLELKAEGGSKETIAPQSDSSGEQAVRKRMSNLRRVIAQRLVEAKNSTAMLTTFNEVDMTTIMDIRAREKENFAKRYGVRLGFMSFFVKVAAYALKNFPDVNSRIEGDEIVTYQNADIGVAVSTERGLMVPVIRRCDALTFAEVEQAIEHFSKKAREGTISIDDLRGGSFTITNGGVFGSLLSTPILNPPQSAILGMHAIQKRAVVVQDQITIRPMMYLALSYDHRIIDGKEAVLFLVHMKEHLEDPARLLLEL